MIIDSNLIDTVSKVVFVASAIANVTPTNKDNMILGMISRLVNFFALNWKKR